MPTSEELATIAIQSARFAKRLGYDPRVAMLAYSTFGHPEGERSVSFSRVQRPGSRSAS